MLTTHKCLGEQEQLHSASPRVSDHQSLSRSQEKRLISDEHNNLLPQRVKIKILDDLHNQI